MPGEPRPKLVAALAELDKRAEAHVEHLQETAQPR